MASIIFKSIPKEFKYLFKNRGFGKKSRTFTLNAADNIIREVSKQLADHKYITISFQLNWEDNGELHEALFEDIEIDNTDYEFGIGGIINRDISHEQGSEADSVRELIDTVLGNRLNSVSSVVDSQSNDEIDEIELNDVQTLGENKIFSPQDEEIDSPELIYPEIESDIDSIVSDINSQNITQQKPTQSMINNSVDSTSFLRENTADLSIIGLDDFTDRKNFDKIISQISTDPFSMERFYTQLGFVTDPADEYDEELNKFINEKINEFGSNELENKFNMDIQKLQNAVIDDLTTTYRQTTEVPLFDEVEGNTQSVIEDITSNYESDIENNKAEIEEKIVHKSDSLNTEIEEKTKNYRQKLQNDCDNELKRYRDTLERDAKIIESNLLARKDNAIIEAKTIAEKDIITTRNKDLISYRNDKLSDFSTDLNDVYSKMSADALEKAKNLQSIVLEKKLILEKQRKLDAQTRLENQREDRKLELKQRQIKVMEVQQSETPQKFAQKVINEIDPYITDKLSTLQTISENSNQTQSELKKINQILSQLDSTTDEVDTGYQTPILNTTGNGSISYEK